MCGVIGIYLTNVTNSDIQLVENLFKQSMIRGKHATGLTYVKENGKLSTIKEPIPSIEFLKKYSIKDFVSNKCLKLIGHIRYSTSDLRYNQPFQGKNVSIAHNGVISQDPNKWEYETETLNDSELILRCIESGDSPLEVYANRSMSVVVLEEDTLYGFRNQERPLWMSYRDNGLIFASTEDILKRSGVEDISIQKCNPMVLYSYNSFSGVSADPRHYSIDVEDLQC